MKTAFKFSKYLQINLDLFFLLLMLLPKFNYGQEQIRCTIIYSDSVTETQPYQLVFDTVKMYYVDSWHRVDYIVNEPDI